MMSIDEKQKLVRLPGLYQQELLEKNEENATNFIKSKKGDNRDLNPPICGLKAQYEHARILIQKLSLEIGDNILPNHAMWW